MCHDNSPFLVLLLLKRFPVYLFFFIKVFSVMFTDLSQNSAGIRFFPDAKEPQNS